MGDCDGGELPEAPELPLEVLVYILSFLHTSDRKEASLVCSRWYEASQDLQFQRKVIFCIPASASSLELIRALGRRSVCRLSIRQLDGFSVSRLLLQEVGVCLGPRLESLALPGSSLTEASLLGLLPRLTSLRRLDLRGLDSLFMSGAFLSWEEHRQQVRAALCGLEELDLSDLRYLSDLTFNRLTSCTPRLRRLALAGCHITFEFDPYRGRPAGAAEDSSALLSLRNLRRLLAEQKATLVALDLSRTSISPESLRSIAQVQGLVLEELLLQGCKELTDYVVEALVEHQPRLRCLDLSGCPELSSRSTEAAWRLAGPVRLSLSGDWRITEKGLADLLAVRTLRSLDLSGCPRVSGAEMAKGLKGSGGAAGAPLESLNLNGCIYIRDSVVLALAQLLGASLRELDLTSCVHLTDLSVCSITTHLRKLAVLRLARCPEITDRGLLGMAEAAKNSSDQEMGDGGPRFTGTSGLMGFFKPPRLPFQERPQVAAPPDPDPDPSRRPLGVSLLALRRLQELDLSACPRLSDGSIAQVVQHPELQRLSLSALSDITDASLAAVARRCPSLSSLALRRCPGISDRGVAQAAPHLPRLQHLYLSGCHNVTDRSLFTLLQHCGRLRTLDISGCPNVAATTADFLQSQLPFLEDLHYKSNGAV